MKALVVILMAVGLSAGAANAGGLTAQEWQCREWANSDDGAERRMARSPRCTGERVRPISRRAQQRISEIFLQELESGDGNDRHQARNLNRVRRPTSPTHQQRVRRIICTELLNSDDGADRNRARHMGCRNR